MTSLYHRFPRPSWHPDQTTWVLSWVTLALIATTLLLAFFTTDNEPLQWFAVGWSVVAALSTLVFNGWVWRECKK